MRAGARRVLLLTLVLALGGCDWIGGIFEDTNKVHLKGDRISVLGLEKRLEPDPKLAEIQVHLPPAVANADWPEPGGNPSHAMQHVAFAGSLKQLWSADLGDGASRYGRVVSQPIVADGLVFGMDARDHVVAVDAKSGDEKWEMDPKPKAARDEAFGGGLAAANGRVFVTTGYGQVLALDAKTGKELWRQQVAAPMRGAPTVAGDRVFAITVENQLDVLSAEDGHRLWTHSGIPETAGLLGAASPAVDGDIVVVPYSSGELF
ncbi:MAG TPA: PQQ-binding-like beta-propeller repeat protein, partial [Stellaceae bacterium]